MICPSRVVVDSPRVKQSDNQILSPTYHLFSTIVADQNVEHRSSGVLVAQNLNHHFPRGVDSSRLWPSC